MLRQKNREFLTDFAEEVILVLVAGLRAKELEQQNLVKSNRAVEAEKFKMKVFPQKAVLSQLSVQPPQIQPSQKPVMNNQNMQPSIMFAPQQPISQLKPQIQQRQNIQQPQNIKLANPEIKIKQEISQDIKKEVKTEEHKEIQKGIKNVEKITEIRSNQNIQLQPGEINFGRIIFLIRDPLITYIECPGENQNIVIKKAGQTLKTQLILTQEEINLIIKSFSEKTRIPLVEGLLNARYENLEISAVVSETISPSFIIRKDIIPQMPRTNQYLMRNNY